MKKTAQILWMGVIFLLSTTGYSQQPIMSADSIPAYSTIKGLVPDCDRSAVAFSVFKNGGWVFREQASFGYALCMNASGDAVNITPEFALESVQDAQTNILRKGLSGYIAGLSQGKDGNWCVSINEILQTFDGYFWFRVNSKWSMYLRDGCLNPALVYDPKKELAPKPGFELAPIVKCDTTIVIVNCPPPVINIPSQAPCTNCCPGDSIKYTFNAFGVLDYQRTGGQLSKSFGAGLQFTQWNLHRNDKAETWFETPTSWYGGITAYLGKKDGIEFKPTCDTCGYWGDIPSNKVAFRADVFFGIQHRIFKKVGAFGFAEARYDWLNSENRRGKFLSDENIKVRSGLRVVVSTPRKVPVFRSVQVELGPQIATYATPNNNLAVGAGGFLVLRANIGKRDAETRNEVDQKKREALYRQFQRDSVLREEKLVRDSIERDSFFNQNPQPILIDTVALALDTTIHAPVLPWVKVPLPPMPFTKTAKVIKLNKAKMKLHSLQLQHNELRIASKSNVNEWPKLQKNIRQLKKAEKNLKKKQARVNK